MSIQFFWRGLVVTVDHPHEVEAIVRLGEKMDVEDRRPKGLEKSVPELMREREAKFSELANSR